MPTSRRSPRNASQSASALFAFSGSCRIAVTAIIGSLSGLVYGAAREGLAVGWSMWRFQVERTVAALETFRGRAQMLNGVTIVFGAIGLVLLSVIDA